MTNRNDEPNRGSMQADRDRDLDARLAAYLRNAPTRAPEHLLEAAASRVHATPQRRRRWRTGGSMASWVAIAAAVALAVTASLRFVTQPDPDVAASPSLSTSLVVIGPGREPAVAERTATPTTVRSVVVIDGTPWAVLVDGLVFQIDAVTGEVLTDLDAQLEEPTGVAAGAGAVWIGSADGDLVKVDAASRTIEAELAVGIPHHAVAANDAAVWVAGPTGARRVDATTLDVTPFALPPGVLELAVVGDDVWATYASGAIVAADGRSGALRATIHARSEAGGQPGGVMAGGPDDLWVSDPAAGSALHRVDPQAARLVASMSFEPPGSPTALAADPGGVWVLFGEQGSIVRLEGDTLEVSDVMDVGVGGRGIGLVPGGLALWGAGGMRVLAVEDDG